MMSELRNLLKIEHSKLDAINKFLLDPDNPMINKFLGIIEKYGGPEAINRKAVDARKLENLFDRLKQMESSYLKDLEWLIKQRDSRSFISFSDYRQNLLDNDFGCPIRHKATAVTLEISALQFFPWLIAEAKRAIEKRQLMPGRFIRVRNMKEQSEDDGDILAVAAAMQLIGSSYVETLDTRGTDGSNIHLGGPETITGYFGGIGQPNDYPLKWVDEYLYYYTTFGIQQVLNINAGTVLVGCLLHKLGIDNGFKISVYMGNDNPFAVLWTFMGACLLSRDDGTTSLNGLNFSNSVNNATILDSDYIRRALGLSDRVRFEHHITETYRSIVRQPYNRRDELVEIAQTVPNISAKHEGGDLEVEQRREHPSDILEYFLSKKEILERGLMDILMQNYLDKHDAVNITAQKLIRAGIGVICAQNLH